MIQTTVTIHVLGAGLEVGRSCYLVTFIPPNGEEAAILLDCGVHVGTTKERFPPIYSLNVDKIKAVVISHFHLDHIGAIPILANIFKTDVPIFMTHPTKAIAPLILEDLIKVSLRGSGSLITSEQIESILNAVHPLAFKQTVNVNGFSITLFPAGHILGAAMVYVEYNNVSLFYTGDFSPLADHHLSPALPIFLNTDILLSEATAMTNPRINTADRDQRFLSLIHETVLKGGKVLVPSTGLGRMQEICATCDSYWENNSIDVPVYFSTGLSPHADVAYLHYGSWTCLPGGVRYKRIKPFSWTTISADHPCVVFAAPGMLQGGTALELFKRWAGDPKNTVILPGYCVTNTFAARVLAGEVSSFEVDGERVEVKCRIAQLEFSAHSDGLGICRLIKGLRPKTIVLVHAEKRKMNTFKAHLMSPKFSSVKLGSVYTPSTGDLITIDVDKGIMVEIDRELYNQSNTQSMHLDFPKRESGKVDFLHGLLYHSEGRTFILDRFSSPDVSQHLVYLVSTIEFDIGSSINFREFVNDLRVKLNGFLGSSLVVDDPLVLWSNGKTGEDLIKIFEHQEESGRIFLSCGHFCEAFLPSISSIINSCITDSKSSFSLADFLSDVPSFHEFPDVWPQFVDV
ncbi:hypothetical protein P9112_014125 [Eukaryota sp. TZLM1-RC]